MNSSELKATLQVAIFFSRIENLNVSQCLGNHEFDNGVTGLLPFLKNAQFPLVAANLDWSFEPEMMNQTQLKKSHVLEVRGRKIGIIGYLTPSTATLGVTGKVRFLDEIESIRQEIASLKTQHGKDGNTIFLNQNGYFL